jgi:DNA-binding NarL/FixJ family response regulator
MVSRGREINLVLVSGVRLFGDCMRAALDKHENIAVSIDSKSLREVVGAAIPLKADVILVEDNELGDDKIQNLKTLQKKFPQSKTLVISADKDEKRLLGYIEAGAYGYLTADSNLSDLCKAINALERDECWIERKIAAKLIKQTQQGASPRHTVKTKRDKALSKREKEILAELKKGLTNKQIAEALFISEKTVKSHLRNIFKKLNVSRRFEAVIRALQKGVA